ncbi:uncharacterized protein LOC128389382 [Panonychus citri]|uniref:uncharacterized protein LOC128389382 n=1 Tax=Panonychus citri TaxID=50023 RepID=UPI0023082B9E|nr:uncharacterized protein LOC128389382 [Panonychus citri]
MVKFLVIVSLIFTLSLAFTSAEDDLDISPIPLLLWAASDPFEEIEVEKINMYNFVKFTEAHRAEINKFYENDDILGVTRLMEDNAEESGTVGVDWQAVAAKIAFKKQTGLTEDKEHGVPSLVAWAMRNTGPGTSHPSVVRTDLLIFILIHKNIIIEYLDNGDVKGLVNYMVLTSNLSGTTSVDWNEVIHYLKDERQLYQFPCGFMYLELCDRTKQ